MIIIVIIMESLGLIYAEALPCLENLDVAVSSQRRNAQNNLPFPTFIRYYSTF